MPARDEALIMASDGFAKEKNKTRHKQRSHTAMRMVMKMAINNDNDMNAVLLLVSLILI